MPRVTYEEKLSHKNFYRTYLRRGVATLYFSLFVMVALVLGIIYVHVSRTNVVYYASNSAGAGFITELTPMAGPNQSSEALLPPDPPEEAVIKEFNL